MAGDTVGTRKESLGIVRKLLTDARETSYALDAVIIQKALDESRIEVFMLRNRRLAAKLQTDSRSPPGEYVCPIFPQPPGIGRKISGASSTNAAC
jgi:hypothetical protein